ncbi:MAG: hypothetical protein WD250_11245 [Egibacteraceae bacterium]
MEDEACTGWPALFAGAHARHGALHLRRSDEVGLPRRAVRRRATREIWEKLLPSVFVLPGSVDGWWRTTAARLELVGSDAVLARLSAAHAHGMRWKPPPITQVVRQLGKHRTEHEEVLVKLSRTLTEADIVVVDGLRATNPQRTMRDLSATLARSRLRAVGIDGITKGVLDFDLLVTEHEAMRPGPPRRLLGQVLGDLASVHTESPFAYEVLEAVAESGLAVEGEFPWRCPDGRIIHFDGAISAAWVAIECDGRSKYQSGRSFTTDRIRWTQASGRWRIVWVSWQRWQNQPHAVLDDVAVAVAAADAAATPAPRADCRCPRCKARAQRSEAWPRP